jgi:NADH-quinone oxidoreductase subunit M
MTSLLPILLLLPLVGAVVGALLPKPALAKSWALLVSLATLAVAVAIGFSIVKTPNYVLDYAPTPGGPLTLPALGISFHLALDWVGYTLVLLTALLMPLAILSSFGSVTQRQTEYYAWMQALAVAMIGVFLARDLLLFYVFFELTLVPMFFIIGIWGGPDRRYAAAKFFLFTFAGSVFTLAAIIYLGVHARSFDLANRSAARSAGGSRSACSPASR